MKKASLGMFVLMNSRGWPPSRLPDGSSLALQRAAPAASDGEEPTHEQKTREGRAAIERSPAAAAAAVVVAGVIVIAGLHGPGVGRRRNRGQLLRPRGVGVA